MERFSRLAAEALNPLLIARGLDPIEPFDLEIPPDRDLGDLAFPCFRYSKALKKAPPEIAKALAVELGQSVVLQQNRMTAQAVGPYLNFVIAPDEVYAQVLGDILKGSELGTYAQQPPRSRDKWILEFSSPNVAKPMHVGHLRTTVLGAALARIGLYRGLDVIRINHLGDWGTQFGKLAVALERYKDTLPAHPTIDDLLRIYVRFHEEAAQDPSLEDQARDAFARLEAGDPEVKQKWEKILEISLKEFDQLYKRLGVEFDYVWGESFYKDQLAPLIEELKARKIAVESDGAWIVPLEDEKGAELTPCLLQKKDGSTIYATRDIAAAIYRHKKFKFDRMSYLVGAEQKLHFSQVFGVLKKMGFGWVDRCEHIAFGLYRFKDARLSTRKGNVVTLEAVLDATREKVSELLESRARDYSAAQKKDITEAVAVGAVVFFELSTDPVRDVQFELERVADFEGETGPYLQYAHTRCLSILRKADEEQGLTPAFDLKPLSKLTTGQEVRLAKTLGHFPYYLERALRHAKANQLTNYLIDVTKDFNSFYRECKVLGDDAELTRARLLLVEATRRILGRGLQLLGIPLPERM